MKDFLLKIKFSNFIFNVFKFKNFFKLIKVIFSRIILRIFSFGLKVPKWHLNATYESCHYKSKVINIKYV